MEKRLITKQELENNIECLKDKYSKIFSSIKEDAVENYYGNPINCLNDLKSNISSFFEGLYDVIDIQQYRNSENKLIGYSIITEFKALDDNKNEYTQYIKFTLAYRYMSIIEDSNLAKLLRVNNKEGEI